MMQQPLPPLPKLRPRPGFAGRDKEDTNPGKGVAVRDQEPEEEQTTSRLLMKSEFGRGSGRKRSSGGSLVHSIPKFSQVRPHGRLTEVQKVLQSSIISKQQQRLLKQQQQEEQHKLLGLQQPMQQDDQNPRLHHPVPAILDSGSDLRASGLLQNIITYHEKQRTEKESGVKVEDESSTTKSFKRRGRKPAKEAICHVVVTPSSHDNDSKNHKSDIPDATRLRQGNSIQGLLPILPEVTITPAVKVPDQALDLRKRQEERQKSPSPEIIEVVRSSGQPPGPSSNAFRTPGYLAHNARLEVLAHNSNSCSDSQLSPATLLTPSAEAFESMRTVMKLRPPSKRLQPTDSDGGTNPKRTPAKWKTGSDANNEVSMCKFKFTGGAKPSLEEKKMVSVDSDGNLRFFSPASTAASGGGEQRVLRGCEQLSADTMLRAGASVVTDRFTALTADRMVARKT